MNSGGALLRSKGPKYLAKTTINRLRAWTVLLIMGLVLGLSFSFGKIAATGGAHPLSISLWQCLTASVLLVAIACAQRRRFSVTPKLANFYIAIALLGLVISTALFYYAASHVSAGVLAISVALVPILTFLGSAVYGLEKIVFSRMAGVALGLLAIVFLVAPTESLPASISTPLGLAVTICCGLLRQSEHAFISQGSAGCRSFRGDLWNVCGSIIDHGACRIANRKFYAPYLAMGTRRVDDGWPRCY